MGWCDKIKDWIMNNIKKLFWFDWVYFGLLLLMILLMILEKFIGLKNFGFAIGISIFTIWTIFYKYFNKDRERKFYAENYIFSFIFVGYSVLSWILVFMTMGLMSPIIFVFSILFVVATFYGMALFIWSNILGKNRRNPLVLMLSYLMLTFLIITIFVGLYAGIGELSINNVSVAKSNLTSFDYYYFSTMTFVGSSFGDYCPMENAKIVAMIESYLGMFFNVIIIGVVLTRFLKDPDKKP